MEVGWLVAEYGRQPWIIEGVLPTFYAASGLTMVDLAISLGFFLILYTTLAIIEVFLLVKVIKHGPVKGNPLSPSFPLRRTCRSARPPDRALSAAQARTNTMSIPLDYETLR